MTVEESTTVHVAWCKRHGTFAVLEEIRRSVTEI